MTKKEGNGEHSGAADSACPPSESCLRNSSKGDGGGKRKRRVVSFRLCHLDKHKCTNK
jgi:hypothetical protein